MPKERKTRRTGRYRGSGSPGLRARCAVPKTGVATLPLHYGKAPKWLFSRMTVLCREILRAVVSECGRQALLERLSDPFWFQSLGCVVGFDWHSSGLTTTLTGALRQGVKGLEREIGISMAGGKGAASRMTPAHIEASAADLGVELAPLVYASRMSAKVDNTAVQDGYQLYHHVFVFGADGSWAVIQQGMNGETRQARRYHWLGSTVEDFVVEPHAAVCCDARHPTLNLVARESDGARQVTTELSRERPERVLAEVRAMQSLDLPARHHIMPQDMDFKRLYRILLTTYERQPENFEALLGMGGVGPKTIRALSLVSELIYGQSPSFRDPARFSFAHGGKDGIPFPVDRRTYDRTVEAMRQAIRSAKVGQRDRLEAIRRLAVYYDF